MLSYFMLTQNSKDYQNKNFLSKGFICFGHTDICFTGFICTSRIKRMEDREKIRMKYLSFNHVYYPQ